MLNLKWGPIIGGLIISERIWNKLPIEYHSILDRISKEMETEARALVFEINEALNVMVENGLTIHQPSAEDRETWEELTVSFYPLIRGSLVPEGIFDKAIKLKKDLVEK